VPGGLHGSFNKKNKIMLTPAEEQELDVSKP